MMRDQLIPDEVRRKVRDYFRRAKQLTKRLSYFGLIDSTLSHKLKSDLRILMSRNTFDPVCTRNTSAARGTLYPRTACTGMHAQALHRHAHRHTYDTYMVYTHAHDRPHA